MLVCIRIVRLLFAELLLRERRELSEVCTSQASSMDVCELAKVLLSDVSRGRDGCTVKHVRVGDQGRSKILLTLAKVDRMESIATILRAEYIRNVVILIAGKRALGVVPLHCRSILRGRSHVRHRLERHRQIPRSRSLPCSIHGRC